jgi:hypothetical protein
MMSAAAHAAAPANAHGCTFVPCPMDMVPPPCVEEFTQIFHDLDVDKKGYLKGTFQLELCAMIACPYDNSVLCS